MPQGYGLQGRRGRDLGPQLHDPRAERQQRPLGRDHLGDRLGPGDQPAADRHPHDARAVDGRRRAARTSTPSSTPSAASTSTATASTSSPPRCPTDPNVPGYEERQNISPLHQWVVPPGGIDLIFGAGHLHPGGDNVALTVARDGPDPGTVDGDSPDEVKPLFTSHAHYYEPAGATSWDVSMEATPRDWRISLKGGDTRLDQRHVRRQQGVLVRVDGHSAPRRDPVRRPGGQGPVRRRRRGQGDVRRGRRAHARPPAGEHRQEGRQGPQDHRSAEDQEQGQARAQGRHRDQRLRLLARRLLGLQELPGRARCARRWSSPARA